MASSPEDHRIDELLALIRTGEADDGVREELALYAEDRPGLAGRIAEAERSESLGKGWLTRVEADDAIQRHEARPAVVVERGLGLALVGGGYALAMVTPVVGGAILTAGIGLLTWSFVRTRLATWRKDPYRDVDK